MNTFVGPSRRAQTARRAHWLLAFLVLFSILAGSAGTALALPPEPVDRFPDNYNPPANGFSWSMAPRFGLDGDGDGITDYNTDAAWINPTSFQVSFKGCTSADERIAGRRQNTYDWTIDGTPADLVGCEFSRSLAAGDHTVALSIGAPDGTSSTYTQTVSPKDFLIVSLGDSFASGEGNPDIPREQSARTNYRSGEWVDRRCHRSAYAGPAQAASALEALDPHSSVTFVSLACSGATIVHGINGTYEGTEPLPGEPQYLRPQLEDLRFIAGTRRIDALIVSGGGNDVRFADIIQACLLAEPVLTCNLNPAITGQLDSDIGWMDDIYNDLVYKMVEDTAGTTQNTRLNLANVYFTEYPNLMRAANGNICGSILGELLLPLEMDADELSWAESAFLHRLNQEMQAAVGRAAERYPAIGWHYVDGIDEAFAGPGYGHGYCAGNVAWVRRVHESAWLQGPLFDPPAISLGDLLATKGLMHPNIRGHQAYQEQILPHLLRDLLQLPLPEPPAFTVDDERGSSTNIEGEAGWVTGSCDETDCSVPLRQAGLDVVATDAAALTAASVAVNGVAGCGVAGVTCTPIAGDAQNYGWSFDFTASGYYHLEFSAGNAAEQTASFTHEFRVDLDDPEASAALPAGVPQTAGWFTAPVTVTLAGTDVGSGVAAIEYQLDGVPGQVKAGEVVTVTADGTHTLAYRAVDVAGRQSPTQTLTVRVDTTPPTVTCAAPDGQWHAADVSLACTASDGASGLASAADAAFALDTSVPSGTETANAATGSRAVCDLAGNCAQAGPIAGNQVDRQGPSISLTTPAAATYVLNQAVAAGYTCSDGGSGVATCSGPVAAGEPVDTASVGTKTFTVNAADAVGNQGSQSVSYTVAYDICVLYDQTKAHRAGSTVPVKLQICGAAGVNASSADIVVTATGLTKVDDTASGTVEDPGTANPDNNFRYSETLGGYIYNLSTAGLSSGTWRLNFTVAGDPTTHTVQFDVR